MKAVQQILEEKQKRFANHPFFAMVQDDLPLQQVMSFAPKLTFWVMAFQDVLRLNESLVRDPELKRIALRHRQEDSGHDNWFLHDVSRLGQTPDARVLFGQDHASIRDASYALISEVLRTNDERLRIVLVLALEAAGHVFFERISDFVESKGYSDQLKYFSRHHFQVEQDHDLFADDTDDEFEHIVLPEDVRAEARTMIDRAFGAFELMFDGLVADLQQAQMAVIPAMAAQGMQLRSGAR